MVSSIIDAIVVAFYGDFNRKLAQIRWESGLWSGVTALHPYRAENSLIPRGHNRMFGSILREGKSNGRGTNAVGICRRGDFGGWA